MQIEALIIPPLSQSFFDFGDFFRVHIKRFKNVNLFHNRLLKN